MCSMCFEGFTISLSGKRHVGDPGNDYIAEMAWKSGLDCSTKAAIEFPNGDTLEFDCIVNITTPFGGASTNVSSLEFEIQTDGKSMSKVIDISAKLTNERPKIKISEDKIYEIDDRKNTILKMYQMFRDGDVNDIEMMDEVIKMLLGEKAAKEIDEMNLSIKNYQTIVIAIMASIQEITFEEAEELFRKASGL